jgi:hypothetical protein
MRYFSYLAFIALFSCSAAGLAWSAAPLSQPKMSFEIVTARWPGCAPNCPRWIAAIGQIQRDSIDGFRAVLKEAGGARLPVLIYSGGGSVDGALDLGAEVRGRSLNTVVGRLDADGRVQPSVCLSACPLFFAGGVRRVAPADARIGLHRVTTTLNFARVHRQYLNRRRVSDGALISSELVSERVEKFSQKVERALPAEQSKMRRYVEFVGISADIFPLMDATPAKDIHILFQGEIEWLRLATEFSTPLELVDPGFGLRQASLGGYLREDMVLPLRDLARRKRFYALELFAARGRPNAMALASPYGAPPPVFPLSARGIFGAGPLPTRRDFAAPSGPSLTLIALGPLCARRRSSGLGMIFGATLQGVTPFSALLAIDRRDGSDVDPALAAACAGYP